MSDSEDSTVFYMPKGNPVNTYMMIDVDELAQLRLRAAEADALRAERDRLLECTKETEFAAKCPECDHWTDFGYLEDWGMCYACHIEKKVYTWKAIESDTDPRHIFDETGRCIRCGEDAEEHEAECVEGWTARLEDTIDALRATVAAQAQTIETARERVTLLEFVVTESCGDHPENSCESWCDQCKRGADALRKAFAANAPTPTQGETEGAPKFDNAQEYRDALEKIESVWVGEFVTDEHIAALKMYTIAARALNNADDETDSEA